MSVQLKELKKTSRQTPTAGPSADDRVGFTPGGKPIEGRLQNIVGTSGNRSRIMIAGGSSQGVRVGMTGYIKDGADGALATFEIEAVEANRSYAWVEVDSTKLRANAFIVINTAPPKSKVAGKPRILAHHQAGTTVEILISHGADQGLFQGMQGKLVAADGKSRSFTITKVEARKSYVYFDHTTVDELRGYTKVELVRPSAPVQRRANGGTAAADVESTAQAGVAGASSQLPFLDIIQRSFGKHDVSGVRTQVGGPASEASNALGARAYATGNAVAFASAPDLHTAAHEAAHTVQQVRGAVGFQGLGAADDEHERHADAVADAVVAGGSAEALLDALDVKSSANAIQRKASDEERLVQAAQKSPFHKPTRDVLDWRTRIHPRMMPTPPQSLDCQFEPQSPGPRGEHAAKPEKLKRELDDTTGAWPAIQAVSASVKTTHERMIGEVVTYENASADPTLSALLAAPQGTGSLSRVTNRLRSPEQNGMTVAEMFDDENALSLEAGTRAEISRTERARPVTGQAAGSTFEKAAAVRAAVANLKGSIELLGEARSEVDAAVHFLAEEWNKQKADAIRADIAALREEASALKSVVDVSFAVLAGFAHAAAGETGDTIEKVGELAATLVSQVNDRAIGRLDARLAATTRDIKTERGKALAAQFDARKARVRGVTHGIEAAKNTVVQTLAARSSAYKNLGKAAASELAVSPEEQRKVAAMIAALPLIEHCAIRARSIMNAAVLPQYTEPAGHGLWLAHSAKDPKVSQFLRALGEIEGVRTRYRSHAVHWEHRLAQVRGLANSVGSHPAE